MEQVRYQVEGPVARVTIDRPERHNAMSFQVMQELAEAFDAARDDDEVRVVVLTGAGERAFCAGADLGGIERMSGTVIWYGHRPMSISGAPKVESSEATTKSHDSASPKPPARQ